MPTLQSVTTVADITQKFAQGIVWVVGAVWVYVNYVLDRTHLDRLQLDLEAKIDDTFGRSHLVVTIVIENLGRGKTIITQEGSVLVLSRLDNYYTAMEEGPRWTPIHALKIFDQGRLSPVEEKLIEPGVASKEEQLIQIPIDRGVYLIWLRVRCKKRAFFPWRLNTRTWFTNKIIDLGPPT